MILYCFTERTQLLWFSLVFYRTEKDWDNSLIIKRVLFEVFDCFLPLFYIAFYQLNVVALRRELVGLFWGKCVSEVIPLWDTLFFWGGGWGIGNVIWAKSGLFAVVFPLIQYSDSPTFLPFCFCLRWWNSSPSNRINSPIFDRERSCMENTERLC